MHTPRQMVWGWALGLLIAGVQPAWADAAADRPISATRDTFVFGAGSFSPRDANPAPTGGRYAIYGRAQRHYPSGLHLGLDFLWTDAEYHTPAGLSGGAFTVISDTMNLMTAGLGATVGIGTELGPASLYAGIGAGLYFSRMTLTGSTFGFPGTHEERDTGLGYGAYAGLDFKVGTRSRLGIEARHHALDADFGPLSNGRMAIGGTLMLLTYRHSFAAAP